MALVFLLMLLFLHARLLYIIFGIFHVDWPRAVCSLFSRALADAGS